MNISEAIAFISNAVLTSDIPGREQSDEMICARVEAMQPTLMRSTLYVSWKQAWGVSANLSVDSRVNQDGTYAITCEIGWPTTVYNTQTGRAAVDLHTAVIALAEKIEKEFQA